MTNIFVSWFFITATIPPIVPVITEVTTTPYSVNISWVVQFISYDTETYSVQYGSDVSLQDSSEVVMGSTDGLVTNQVFSVNINGLTPFTTYYYIVWANNSLGSTKTSVMSFTTNETGTIDLVMLVSCTVVCSHSS